MIIKKIIRAVIITLIVLVFIAILIYTYALENILYLRSNAQVNKERIEIEKIIGLEDRAVKDVSVRRSKSRTSYGQTSTRQASAKSYYKIDNLTSATWVAYRDALLKEYSTDEVIATGCDDNPSSTSSCEIKFSKGEGEGVLRNDWSIESRSHRSCYYGPMVDERQIKACISFCPEGTCEYSKYSDEVSYRPHNVILSVYEEPIYWRTQ